MINKLAKKFGFALGCLLALLVFVGLCGVSYLITAGFVYLITLCFDITFSWGLVAGVWLLLWLIGTVFGG